MRNRVCQRMSVMVPLIIAILALESPQAFAQAKVGLYGIRMVPYGSDASSYSRAGWGGGIELVLPFEKSYNILAGTAGLEIVNLLSQEETFQDATSGLTVNQETDQNYFRLFIGAQIGGHGNGFFRPHIGLNLAMVYYNIRTDLVVPDDYDPDREIRQNIRNDGNAVFGYDLTMGVDLNFSNVASLDGGVKYIKSLSVPEQLGQGSVKVHPQYFQIYLELGLPLRIIGNQEKDDIE
jgi:hypothetical protein